MAEASGPCRFRGRGRQALSAPSSSSRPCPASHCCSSRQLLRLLLLLLLLLLIIIITITVIVVILIMIVAISSSRQLLLFSRTSPAFLSHESGPSALGPGWLRAGMCLGETQLWGAEPVGHYRRPNIIWRHGVVAAANSHQAPVGRSQLHVVSRSEGVHAHVHVHARVHAHVSVHV